MTIPPTRQGRVPAAEPGSPAPWRAGTCAGANVTCWPTQMKPEANFAAAVTSWLLGLAASMTKTGVEYSTLRSKESRTGGPSIASRRGRPTARLSMTTATSAIRRHFPTAPNISSARPFPNSYCA